MPATAYVFGKVRPVRSWPSPKVRCGGNGPAVAAVDDEASNVTGLPARGADGL